MTSKFSAFTDRVVETFKVLLINPETDQPWMGKDGKQAFIEVQSVNGEAAALHDKEQRKLSNAKALDLAVKGKDEADLPDQHEMNIAKIARLTVSWHLVDFDGEPLNVPCNIENAVELYSTANVITTSIWRQVFVAATRAENFIKSKVKGSLPLPK